MNHAAGVVACALALSLCACQSGTMLASFHPALTLGVANRSSAPITASGGASPSAGGAAAAANVSDSPAATLVTAAPTGGGGSGGGGSSGGGTGPVPMAGQVLDQFNQPLAGATLSFADGRRATSDANGNYTATGDAGTSAVVVSAPGYATSLVPGGEPVTQFHLRRNDGITGTIVPENVTLTGSVTWPSSDHVGGVAYYEDTLGSLSLPAPVDASGHFTLTVTLYYGVAPLGAVNVLATTSAQAPLVGLSQPVNVATSPTLPAIAMQPTPRMLHYTCSGLGANMTQVRARLNALQPGLPPIPILDYTGPTGAIEAPAKGALPGSLQLVTEARSTDGSADSQVGLPADDTDTFVPAFMPTPSLTLVSSGMTAGWSGIPGAAGYYLATFTSDPSMPTWETWIAAPGASYAVPSSFWQGSVLVEAVDQAGFDQRSIASTDGARRFRVTPWVSSPAYRTASKFVAIGP